MRRPRRLRPRAAARPLRRRPGAGPRAAAGRRVCRRRAGARRQSRGRLRGAQLHRPRLRRSRTTPGPAGIPGGWQRTQWNFLPCGSLCGESAPRSQYQARGGLNAPEAWDILKQRGAAGGKGARGRGSRHRDRLHDQEAPVPQEPGLLPQPVPARLRLRRQGQDAARSRTVTAPTSRGRSRSGPATTSGSPAWRRGRRSCPVRVLDSEGFGTARNIAKGIRFAAAPQGPGDQHELRVLARRRTAAGRSRGSAPRSSTRSRRARWWSRPPATRTASRSPTRPAPRT